VLETTLHAQFGGFGGPRVDADHIFAEVHSCDLEDVFAAKTKRLKQRGSSGNWAPDKLTDAERVRYRKDMGFE
jgi:predicted HAD superfamily Cof-like phosphohydrolase